MLASTVARARRSQRRQRPRQTLTMGKATGVPAATASDGTDGCAVRNTPRSLEAGEPLGTRKPAHGRRHSGVPVMCGAHARLGVSPRDKWFWAFHTLVTVCDVLDAAPVAARQSRFSQADDELTRHSATGARFEAQMQKMRRGPAVAVHRRRSDRKHCAPTARTARTAPPSRSVASRYSRH